jgi:hypothetical protein
MCVEWSDNMSINGTRCGGRGWIILVAVFGVLCLLPAAADAALVSFDLNSAKLDYVNSTKTLVVTENIGSDLLVRYEDGLNVLDSAKIVGGGDFDLTFTLSMFDEPGAENWSAGGTLEFTDTNTTTNAVEGSFVSTNVEIFFTGGVLEIQGLLSNNPPASSILLNRGAPWVFVGEETIPGEHIGDGLDGTAGQITVSNPGDYDEGVAFTLKFGVGTTSLDTLFAADFSKTAGEVKGYVTPEPATMSLLAVGGMAVLMYRRRCRTA